MKALKAVLVTAFFMLSIQLKADCNWLWKPTPKSEPNTTLTELTNSKQELDWATNFLNRAKKTLPDDQALHLTTKQIPIYRDMKAKCKPNFWSAREIDKQVLKDYVKLQTVINITSTTSGYILNHLEKDPLTCQYLMDLIFEVGKDMVLTPINVKTNASSKRAISRMVRSYLNRSIQDIGVVSTYTLVFGPNGICNGFQPKLSPTDTKPTKLPTEDQIVAEELDPLINTGNPALDRYTYNRVYGLLASVKGIFVSAYVYQLLCLKDLEPNNVKIATAFIIAEQFLSTQAYYWGRKQCTKQ